MINNGFHSVGARLLRGICFSAFVLAVAAISCGDAFAAISVPSSVSPGQVSKRFNPDETADNALQLDVPVPSVQKQQTTDSKDKAAKTKFVLNNVAVSGATVYNSSELEQYYKDAIGSSISLQDAKDIAARITARYRNDGYILSQAVVPAQDVSKGELSIRVVEGYIAKVVLDGAADTPEMRESLRGYIEGIEAGRPVKMHDLERYMLLMNDLPGNQVSGLIRPSAKELGGAELVLSVNSKPFEASYSFDNRGSKYIGPWQHVLSFGANSLLTDYDSTFMRVETSTPFEELFGIEVGHDLLLNSMGTKLGFIYSHTRTQPGEDLKSLRIVGKSDMFEVKVSHPFVRTRSQSLSGRAVVDIRNTTTDVFSNVRLNTDKLRVVRLGGTYNMLDALNGSDSFDAQISQGLNVFSATDSGVARSNPIGESDFTKLNFHLSRVQPLPSRFSVLTAMSLQYAFNPLLSDEQFSIGGSDFGRAFDPSEALGDSGISAKAELRYTELVGEKYLQSYQPYAFYDIGETWTRGAGGESKVLSSVGVGARINLTENFSASFEAASPLVKPGNNDQTSYRHNPRLFFTLMARF